MNKALKTIIIVMLNKRYISKKHTPEHKIITSKIKWLQIDEKREFKEQYQKIINAKIILRLKKKNRKRIQLAYKPKSKKTKTII